MFNDICVYIDKKIIEINEKRFDLGRLTAYCMNISPEEYNNLNHIRNAVNEIMKKNSCNDKLYKKYKEQMCELNASNLFNNFFVSKPPLSEWKELSKLLRSLENALSQHQFYTVISSENVQKIFDEVDALTSLKKTDLLWDRYISLIETYN